MSTAPILYGELAAWFHLLTAPHEYDEEAATYLRAMKLGLRSGTLHTLLELGCGGGNNASHLKRELACTLTDVSSPMLDLSLELNPDCEHVLGDMRTMRLGRTFDAVLVHDAICYMTTEDDLRRAIETAFVHTREGGIAVFAPDFVRETFKPMTTCGGNDGEGRGMRYLEWCWDPDPFDSTYLVDYAYLLREGTSTRVVHDRHVEGLFPRDTWLGLLKGAGFAVTTFERILEDEWQDEIFLASR